MALKGDLASVDLAQVFQMLSLNQKVGILGIDAVRSSRALYFDQRGVTIFFDEAAMQERLINRAESRSMIDAAAIQDAEAHSARSGQTVFESLLAGGYLADDVADQLLRDELEEDIYDIFFWQRAQFEFYENAVQLPTGALIKDDRHYFSVDSVIMEAARRIDEWAFIHQRVKSGFDVFRALAVDPSPLEDTDLRMFELCDGTRNVARLIDMTGLPRFQVFKSIAVLHEGGYVEEMPDEELWGAAQACVEARRPEDAIDLFERAIECGADCAAIRTELAVVYESVEEFAKASAHLKHVAASRVEAGELETAVEHLIHSIEMVPTDLEARETLVNLTVGVPESQRGGFDPSTQGKQLVDLYLEIGEVERVRGLLEQLLRVAPNDLALKKRLINVHTKAGDTRRVVELYESIADDLIAERQPIEAVKYLQKIVMIDRQRKDISEKIRSLYEADERRRSRRRSLVALGGLLLLLAGLAAGWYVYERYARDQMIALQESVEELAEQGDFTAAIAALDGFIAKYPLTIVSHDAGAEKARIRSLQDAHEEQLALIGRQRDLERQDLRKQYRAAWADYERFVAKKELAAALRSIERVQKLVEEAGADEDKRWAQDVKLERSRYVLEDHISSAAKLDREAWKALESGDWLTARRNWLEVLGDYEFSATASTIRLPVFLDSRPTGATVYVDGKPLTSKVDGEDVPQRTPAIVLCRPEVTERIELRLEGFAPIAIDVDAKSMDALEPTMRVVPAGVYTFNPVARSKVTPHSNLFAVGLQNGRFVLAAKANGKILCDRPLDGLDEVRGDVTFAVDRCFYVTMSGYVECRRLPAGQLVWREKVRDEILGAPVLGGNAVILTTASGRMLGLDTRSGAQRWSVLLEGTPVGKPVIDGSVAFVGLRESEIVSVDLTTRKVRARSARLESGVATSLTLIGSSLLYGDDRGQIVMQKRISSGRAWSRDLGRTLDEGDIVADGSVAFARSGRNAVECIRLASGEVLGRIEAQSTITAGPFVTNKYVFVVVRRELAGKAPFDLLQAFSRESYELQWEYQDGGRFVADPTSDHATLFVPDSKGQVLRFQ